MQRLTWPLTIYYLFFYLASTDNISGTTQELKVYPEPPIDQITFTAFDCCIVFSCPRTLATQTCFKTKEVKSLESRWLNLLVKLHAHKSALWPDGKDLNCCCRNWLMAKTDQLPVCQKRDMSTQQKCFWPPFLSDKFYRSSISPPDYPCKV